jgi:gluconokinase
MKDYFIGIDIGTGSTKAIAVDHAGKTLASSRAHYPILSPKPSYSEQEPSAILEAFNSCIKNITDTLGTPPKAVSLSSAMHSIIPVDKNGTALMNMITWADNRSEDIADRLKKSPEGRSFYETGGTPIHAMTPICKILWLKEHEGDLFIKTHKFIGIKEYIWFHLFGEFEIDYSLASGTGLFNILSLTWNDAALNFAGIPASKLPTPVNTSSTRTLANDTKVKSLGVNKDTAFVAGAGDGVLANLGSLAIHNGVAALTIGTSGAIRVFSKTPVFNYETMPFNYRLDEKSFISGGPINNGGVAWKWYAQQLLKRKLDSPDDYKVLLDQLNEVPAGSEGLVFLPYILGDRAPIWNSSACGVFFGVTARHQQAHFTRAVLEGISMTLYQVGRTLEDGGLDIDRINVSGGIVHNDQWLQLLADIFGKDICLVNAEDASALGAVYLAMKALGVVKDYNHFESTPVKIFHPRTPNTKVYQNTMYPRFQRLYSLLKDEMRMLHRESVG